MHILIIAYRITEELKADRDVAAEAVRKQGRALEYASEEPNNNDSNRCINNDNDNANANDSDNDHVCISCT